MITKEQVFDALRKVNDPELRINVVDLGLIYAVDIFPDNKINIVMTVTTPGCPVIDQFLQQAHDEVAAIPDVGEVTVHLTFDPLWTPDKITPEVRSALGL